MRTLRAALIATLVLAAPASAAGPLAPGMPDRTFAGDGTLRSKLGSGRTTAASAVLPLASGRLAVVTSDDTVVRLKASGVRDPRFGTRGVARVRFFGDSNDRVVALAEDTDAALVVAGTKGRDVLAVRRLLPNGRVDRAFGGAIVTLATPGFVTGVDVAMAPDGTALVAAVVVRPYSAPVAPSLVVLALDRQGRRVPGFGADGLATIPLDPSFEHSGTALVRLPDGRLRYAINSWVPGRGYRINLAGLTADGQPDTALGPGGMLALGRLLPGIATAASDASGRLLLSVIQSRPRPRLLVRALTPDGAREPAFGADGIARIPLPFRADGPVAAIRANGDAAIAMTRLDRPRRPAVALVRRDGSLRARFGGRGFASVGGFHPRRGTFVDAAAVDGLDRLVLGGTVLAPVEPREDFFLGSDDDAAMARIRLRRSPLSLPSRATVSRKGVMRVRVGCRAAGGCRAALTARRASLRRRTVIRMRAGTQRVVQLRLGQAGVRLAARHLPMRLSVFVSAAGRLEPLAVSVRLRRSG